MTNEVKDISKKTESRLAAVKALYSSELNPSEQTAEELVSDILSYYQTEPEFMGIKLQQSFLTKLVEGVYEHSEKLDEIIIPKIAEGWTYDRLGPVLKAILRAGVYELTTLKGIPFKVIINEYVLITKQFFDDKEVSFVNGILDRIAHEIRDENE